MTGDDHRTRRILLTGGSGQVGFELSRALAAIGTVVTPSSIQLDLTRPDAVRSYVRDLKPTLIINAAAHTAVDLCETERDRAVALNQEAPGLLAVEARKIDSPIIHYSTDYVFDGTKNSPYVEADSPNPLSVYGRTKLGGEQAVQASGAVSLVLRCQWVYSRRGKNFLLTMLRLAREKSSLNVVADQHGSPTWARGIASATADILIMADRAKSGMRAFLEQQSGVYHLAAAGSTTWFGFAEEILKYAPESTAALNAITTAEYPTPARRPANSVFDTSKLQQTFGVSPADWRAQLRQAMTTEQ